MINIRKRGNTYQYCFEAGKINGKRKQITKCGYKTKNEYLHKIFENIKYLSPDQIYEIDSMIYENQYIRNNKKRK